MKTFIWFHLSVCRSALHVSCSLREREGPVPRVQHDLWKACVCLEKCSSAASLSIACLCVSLITSWRRQVFVSCINYCEGRLTARKKKQPAPDCVSEISELTSSCTFVSFKRENFPSTSTSSSLFFFPFFFLSFNR